MVRTLASFIATSLSMGCVPGGFGDGYPRGGNIVVLFMDDVGLDKVGVYGAHPSPAKTPTINRLAEEGFLFKNAYANPTCTPSRAALLTGRHGSRTGLGRWLYLDNPSFDLQDHEVTIAEHLQSSPHDYTSAITGKWHLSSFGREDAEDQPRNQGFAYHAGAMGNPQESMGPGNLPRGYFNWEKVTNGVTEWSDVYMTTDTANEAIAAMERMAPPWLLYVPFNAPHEPVHHPPEDLLSAPLPEDASELQQFEAMIEAMDTEIERIIENIPADQRDNTTVFVIGDNGTPSFGISDPWPSNRSKGSSWESGVHVPMIVWGQHAPLVGEQTDALVHLVDVFATMADIGEANIATALYGSGPWRGERITVDGRSLLPWLHGDPPTDWPQYMYTEGFYPNGEPPYEYHKRMVRDGEWKYRTRDMEGEFMETFHRFGDDFWTEGDDLLEGTMDAEATAAYERLRTEMARLEDALQYGP